MRFAEVFRFEVGYRLRQPSTWLYAALLLGMPFLLLSALDGASSKLNAPHMVAIGTTIVGMVGMLVSAALFGDAATRDFHTGMHPLLYTTPLRKAEYLGGRFAGALVVNAVMLLLVPLGLALASRAPWLDRRMFGPFQLQAYVQPYVLLLLPGMVLTGAILFAVAALTRQMLGAYLGSMAVFVMYLGAADVGDRMANRTLAALMDPFGSFTLERLTQYWTPAQRNAQLIGYPAVMVWNRLLWLGVAALVLLLLHRLFRFAHPGGAGRRKGRRSVEAPGRVAPVTVPAVQGEFGRGTPVWQTLAVFRRSLQEMARNRAFLVLAAGMLAFVFLLGWDVGSVVFGTSSWPLTHLVAGTVLAQGASMVMSLLVILFSGELVWRERDLRVSAIADASPVPDWASLLGRFLALVAMVAALQAVLMGAGMLLQTLQGYHRYEPWLYARILFGIKLADYALLAALAMAVHVLVNQKYLGHLAVVLCYLFTVFSASLGIEHRLLVYGSDTGWIYSDMSGFGPFAGPLVLFKLYWAGWALLLVVAARLFWVRGRHDGLRARMGMARARLTGGAARAVAAAVVLIAGLGGFIFYNTNVLNDYRTQRESDGLKAEYERRYRRYHGLPQPRIERAALRVEIHERSADLRGSYLLVNRTGAAIDSVHVTLHPAVRARSLSFGPAARRAREDRELQYDVFALAAPLAPGDSLRLDFDVAFRPRGFSNSGIPTDVSRNGAYFDRRWLPMIGYQAIQELADPRTRREHALPERPRTAAVGDARGLALRFQPTDADLVHVDVVIGTPREQLAVTPGTLRRTWTENGRRYFHYRTEAPLSFGVPVLSAEYAVRRDRWRNVELQVLHHPTHTFNVDRMVRGMKAALEYNSREFGPYQFGQLRIVEFPRYAGFARAHPHTIAFSEGSAFLTRVHDGDVDRPFFVVAHETAHQWWGGQVMGAGVRGASLVSEMLAQYSAMMVMEKTLGAEQTRRFYDYEMDNYLTGRTVFTNREVPLLQVENQSYLYYHKGAVAMYTLRERLGEERVNAALRRFLEKHRAGVPPFPTSLDLYAELRAAAPDSMRPLLRDLFEEITLWEVGVTSARAEPIGNGAFRVTMEVTASKARADSLGNETAVPMDERVEIGVFAPAAAGEARGAPLYLRPHRIRSGRQTITVLVPRRPARAGIDPLHKLIQRETGDNVVDVP